MIDNINRVNLKSIKQVYDFIRIKSIYYAHEGTFITLWGYIIILIIAYQCFQIHTWRNNRKQSDPENACPIKLYDCWIMFFHQRTVITIIDSVYGPLFVKTSWRLLFINFTSPPKSDLEINQWRIYWEK